MTLRQLVRAASRGRMGCPQGGFGLQRGGRGGTGHAGPELKRALSAAETIELRVPSAGSFVGFERIATWTIGYKPRLSLIAPAPLAVRRRLADGRGRLQPGALQRQIKHAGRLPAFADAAPEVVGVGFVRRVRRLGRQGPRRTEPMPEFAAQAQCNNDAIVIAEPSVGPKSPSVTAHFSA